MIWAVRNSLPDIHRFEISRRGIDWILSIGRMEGPSESSFSKLTDFRASKVSIRCDRLLLEFFPFRDARTLSSALELEEIEEHSLSEDWLLTVSNRSEALRRGLTGA